MTEDDSNDEKSGTEVGSCVNGSRKRKAVPPPEDEILLEPLRGVLIREYIVWRSAADKFSRGQLHLPHGTN